MAAFNRLTEATYEVHETVKVDTQDNEDHTFCGIMFPIKCKELLPVDHISIRSLAVRGQLGPITVWVSKEEKPNNNNVNNVNRNRATTVFRLSPSHWTKVYEAVHQPSQDTYSSLVLDKPIILKPGQVRAIYIHSTLPGDRAIVYDNASFYLPRRGLHPFGGAGRSQTTRRPRYEDAMISIYTGRAHVSNTPFGQMPIWGWGNAWRDHREFVGQLEYGAVYQLWNPETQANFGPQFRSALFNLKLCQTRWESPMSRLPDECIYYILNMCRWDWFSDTRQSMELHQQQQKQLQLQKQQLEEQQKAERQRQEQLEQQQLQQQSTPPAASAAAAAAAIVSEGSSNGAGGQLGSCRAATKSHTTCTGRAYRDGNANESNEDDSDEHYEDALEEQADANDNGNGVEIMDDDFELDEDDEDEDSDEDVDVDEVGFDEDGDDDDEDEEEDDEDSWERANGYRADHNVFRFVDPEREEEESQNNEDEDGSGAARQAWIRRQFERIHVLRALAREQDDDEEVVDMHLVF